jgi:dTMP kinase
MERHSYPGKLIVVEGIDGSGKSTQLALLRKWLVAKKIPVYYTEWNSSQLVKQATKAGKKSETLTPITFSLLHATDFADRHSYEITPPLKAGMVVLADRYAYTAFARDRARGVHPEWVRNVYSFATRPDIAFYYRVPLDISVKRLLTSRAKLKYYEAGMDMKLSTDLVESFRKFQERVIAEYEKLTVEFNLTPMDATKAINTQQRRMRRIVAKELGMPQEAAETEEALLS